MPDLNAPAVAGWLRERDPDAVALPVIGPVDNDPAVLRTLLRLGELLDDALAEDAQSLSERLCHRVTALNLRAALTQVGPARRMRILAWLLEEGLPEQDALMAAATAAGPDGDYIRGELQALHRRALLANIFGPERIRSLLAACQPTGLAGGAA